MSKDTFQIETPDGDIVWHRHKPATGPDVIFKMIAHGRDVHIGHGQHDSERMGLVPAGIVTRQASEAELTPAQVRGLNARRAVDMVLAVEEIADLVHAVESGEQERMIVGDEWSVLVWKDGMQTFVAIVDHGVFDGGGFGNGENWPRVICEVGFDEDGPPRTVDIETRARTEEDEPEKEFTGVLVPDMGLCNHDRAVIGARARLAIIDGVEPVDFDRQAANAANAA